MIKKRITAAFCAFLILFQSIIIPTRAQANPLLAVVAFDLCMASTACVNIGGAIIGSTIAVLAVHFSGADLRFPVSSDPAKAIPEPTAPPSAAMIPAVNSCAYWSASNGYSAETTDCGGGNAAICAALGGTYTGACTIGSLTYGSWYYTGSVPAHCPSGFVQSGSACILSDSRAAAQDARGDYTRQGGALVPPAATDADVADPASPTNAALKNTTPIAGGTGQRVIGKDNSGNPLVVDIVPRADGGTTVTQSVPIVDANGNSGVRQNVLGIGSSGVIDSASQTTTNGSITFPTDAAGQLTPAGVVVAAGTAAVATGAAGTTIPSDYARTGEAATAAATIATALSVSTSPIDSPEGTDISNFVGDSGQIPTFDKTGLEGNIVLPSSNDTCNPLHIAWRGIDWVWDICPMVNFLHPLVNYMFIFLFGILTLRTLLKNDEVVK